MFNQKNMWINLEPKESIINLNLHSFNDFENDEWEYIFWNEKAEEEGSDDPNKQSELFMDSIGNLHDSSKRIKKNESLGRGYKKKVSMTYMKKETQKSEFSNTGHGKESPRNTPISRNLTILRRNVSKKSTQNSYSSQSIKESDGRHDSPKEDPKVVLGASQVSLPNSRISNKKERGIGTKSKNIARVLNENQRKDLTKIHKSVDEFLFLMENPSSWVSKLEIEYKDYLRGT
jgi:hypothetical protein